MPISTNTLPQICSDETLVETLKGVARQYKGDYVESKDLVPYFYGELQKLQKLEDEVKLLKLSNKSKDSEIKFLNICRGVY